MEARLAEVFAEDRERARAARAQVAGGREILHEREGGIIIFSACRRSGERDDHGDGRDSLA
jgi:hypothetical protein